MHGAVCLARLKILCVLQHFYPCFVVVLGDALHLDVPASSHIVALATFRVANARNLRARWHAEQEYSTFYVQRLCIQTFIFTAHNRSLAVLDFWKSSIG